VHRRPKQATLGALAELIHRHAFSSRLTVSKHRLANGLHVLLLPDPIAPVLSYHTWYRIGSRHERQGKTGLAHLFEHLMFNQTANLEAGEFDRRMEMAGGDTNAATWVDWTYYRDNVPASQLELAVRLEADRMHNLTLTEKQVLSEREVVANERRFRVDDDVEGFLGEEMFRLAFTTHPYHWPTIGWMEDILGTTPDDARAFYRRFYSPTNATLVLVGDFEEQAALERIEAAYGPIPGKDVPEDLVPEEPPQTEERRARHAKPVVAERAVVAWKAPAMGHGDWMLLQVAVEILTGGLSAALHRRLVVEEEMASQLQAHLAPTRDPGLVEVFLAMKRGRRFDEAMPIIEEELARLRDAGPAPEELEKARNRLETSFWSELETADGKAEALGHFETTLGDWRRVLEVAARLPMISADEVRRAARTYLVSSGRTIVVAEPSGEADGDDGDDDGDGDDA
jgi:zinc protease